jgi:hypothetical protein
MTRIQMVFFWFVAPCSLLVVFHPMLCPCLYKILINEQKKICSFQSHTYALRQLNLLRFVFPERPIGTTSQIHLCACNLTERCTQRLVKHFETAEIATQLSLFFSSPQFRPALGPTQPGYLGIKQPERVADHY